MDYSSIPWSDWNEQHTQLIKFVALLNSHIEDSYLSVSHCEAFLEGKRKLMNYLLTDYIPKEVEKTWQKFHGLLKGMKDSIRNALECISEDLARFQNYSSEDEEEFDEGEPETGTLSERRLKWKGGEVWTNPDVVKVLKRVTGYTDSGNLFVRVSDQSNIRVIPLFNASLPSSNENVTFYLGFSLHGVVAFDIKVAE
ncbi:sterile alpha motif domain-containing protein 9-like [Pimephales promelas]|nr:sterile alpha motif domain-containing protein 9-like [Pimephales promelas]